MSCNADGTPVPVDFPDIPQQSTTMTWTASQLQDYVDEQIRLRQITNIGLSSAGAASSSQHSTSATNIPQAHNIASVAFKAPQPLHSQNPRVWFNILEQSFQLANIRSEQTKYAHALAALDARHHDSFADLILRDKGTVPYTAFKEEVIQVLDESERSKLNNLLHGLTLGDQKPSQLLNKFRLNAGRTFDENALRQLWMKRLPAQVQMILTPFENDVPLITLAARADNILETMAQSSNYTVASVASTSKEYKKNESVPVKSELENRVDKLTLMVSELCATFKNSRSRNNSQSPAFGNRSRSRSASKSKINPKYDQCYYHFKFGTNARKCITGCKFFNEHNATDKTDF